MQIYNYIRKISSGTRNKKGLRRFCKFSWIFRQKMKLYCITSSAFEHAFHNAHQKEELWLLSVLFCRTKSKNNLGKKIITKLLAKDLKLLNHGYLGRGSHCSNHMVSRVKENNPIQQCSCHLNIRTAIA